MPAPRKAARKGHEPQTITADHRESRTHFLGLASESRHTSKFGKEDVQLVACSAPPYPAQCPSRVRLTLQSWARGKRGQLAQYPTQKTWQTSGAAHNTGHARSRAPASPGGHTNVTETIAQVMRR